MAVSGKRLPVPTGGCFAVARRQTARYIPFMRYLFLILFCLPALTVAGEVYRWVDSEGIVHYSDTPAIGAEQVEIAPPSTVPAWRGSGGEPVPEDEGNTAAYETVRITEPAEQEVIRAPGGEVTINIELVPDLKPGHQLALALDGSRIAAGNSSRVTLQGLTPGPHDVTASVIDADETVLATAQSVRFFLRQPSAINRPDALGRPTAPTAPAAPGVPVGTTPPAD